MRVVFLAISSRQKRYRMHDLQSFARWRAHRLPIALRSRIRRGHDLRAVASILAIFLSSSFRDISGWVIL